MVVCMDVYDEPCAMRNLRNIVSQTQLVLCVLRTQADCLRKYLKWLHASSV